MQQLGPTRKTVNPSQQMSGVSFVLEMIETIISSPDLDIFFLLASHKLDSGCSFFKCFYHLQEIHLLKLLAPRSPKLVFACKWVHKHKRRWEVLCFFSCAFPEMKFMLFRPKTFLVADDNEARHCMKIKIGSFQQKSHLHYFLFLHEGVAAYICKRQKTNHWTKGDLVDFVCGAIQCCLSWAKEDSVSTDVFCVLCLKWNKLWQLSLCLVFVLGRRPTQLLNIFFLAEEKVNM